MHLTLAPRLECRPSPALVAFAHLLALPATDLEREIAEEVERNPALEWRGAPMPGAGDDAVNRLAGIPAVPSAADALLADVRLALRPEDHAIAEYLVGCLDGRGMLAEKVDSIARALSVPSERVEAALRAVRDAGPPGIAARDLRECLLRQLDEPEARAGAHPLARAIVDEHLQNLADGLYGAIAAATGTSRDEVLAARDDIRRRLRPYPAFDAPGSGAPVARVMPDVVVRRADAGPQQLEVELAEPQRIVLGIEPAYASPAGQARPELARARLLLARLQQRWRTMRLVARAAVARQRAFVLAGPSALVPLTRAEIAGDVGVHESTVSRATAGRHVLLPDGRLVAFSMFFDAALPARRALQRLVDAERSPRSDAELADALRRNGFPVARRTVAKYRTELGILPHSLR